MRDARPDNERRPNGAAFPMTSDSDSGDSEPGRPVSEPEVYPNHEELPHALGSLAGMYPIVLLLALFWSIPVIAWLTDSGSTELFLIWLLPTAFFLALGLLIVRDQRSQTPASIELTPSALIVDWGGAARGRRQTIPFRTIIALTPRKWRWVNEGKASRYVFSPPTVHVRGPESPPEHGWTVVEYDRRGFFVTRRNLERIRHAVEHWRGIGTLPEETPLVSDDPPAD